MELFKIFGTIAIRNQEAIDGIDETTGKAESSSGKMAAAFKKIGSAVATYLAVDKIIDFGAACLEAAANVQATESQFAQVFGDLSGSASDSLAAIAESAGISENRMKGSYTKIASFAKTTGMETADALSLADRALIAVADSAAFYDRSLEETTESLQSFLKGNYENDSALGLSCTETTRNAAANELYGKSFQDLSEAQKQLTLLQMVEDANAASGALGQAARESDTWTNQTGNLKQAWTDFKAVIGANFLEPAVNAVKGVTDVVVRLTDKIPVVVEWFKTMYSSASGHFSALWSEVQQVWNSLGQPIWNLIQDCIGVVRDKFSQVMPEIKEFVSNCFSDISDYWNNHLQPCFEAIGNFIENVLAPIFTAVFEGIISPVVDACFNNIKGFWENNLMPVLTGITDFLTGVFSGDWQLAWNGIMSIVDGIFGDIIDAAQGLIDGATEKFSQLVTTVSEKFTEIKTAALEKWAEIKGVFADALAVGQKIIDDIKQGITDAWTDLTSWFSNLWNSLFGNLSVNVGVNKGVSGGGTGGNVPSYRQFASGLDYVPYDGYVAELHKGEMVLTASEATAFRNGSGGTIANSDVAIILTNILDAIQEGNSKDTVMKLNNREFGRLVKAVN